MTEQTPNAGERRSGDGDREPDEYVSEHIRTALATDPRVNELEIDIRVVGDKVFATGVVASQQRRESIEQVIKENAPQLRVVNQTSVSDFPTPAEPEDVT